MEIVSAIAQVAQPIIDYALAPVARQVDYLLFYNTNFKNLEDQVAGLKRVKDTTIHEVEAERRNGRQIYDGVHSWLSKLDKIVEEAEKLSDDPRRRNAGCCKGPFPPNLKSRHQLSRKAKKLAASVAEVMQGKQSIYPLAFLPNLEGVGSTSATTSEKLESRKKLKKDIVLALGDPDLSRIGVYGLGGVGKTTLVEEIANQVKYDELFVEVVMVNISQAPDLKRIQGEIADLLGLRFEEKTVVGRALRLKQRIKNEKSILFILDDIWSTLELEKLGIPLKDHKGCKLLLTSRNQEILQKLETQKDFLVDVLKEEEAWSLFEDMVGDVVKDVSLRDVAIQVAQKCAGLILLVVTVARALKNKDNIDYWNDALNQLKTFDKEGRNGIIYSALELSYNHLEGDDVKALFLLCGILGPHITVEYLLKCSMGLGMLKQIHTQKDARLRLRSLIDSLKASCLLIESNSNKLVKMHDIIHEVALSIASRDQHVCKIGRANELWPPEEFLQRCTQINIKGCCIRELPERLECPNIKFFYLHNENESLSVPDSFFEGMKNLKVLDLTHIYLPSLPESFHSLIDLQTMCLDYCDLKDMTNIEALTNLQILSLYGSSMIRLPSELGRLTHLRMLDLSKSRIEIFPSNIISKLTKLEEFHMGNATIEWDQEDSIEENKNASLSELSHLTNLTALEIQIKGASLLPRNIMFNKLERYNIGIGDVWEWSDNYGASKTLKLKISTVIHLEHGIKELIKGVEVLYLEEVNGISNVLYDLNGEGFPKIKHLHIQNNGKIQHIINTMQREASNVFFPRLETLELQNLKNLEKICHGSFVNSSFAKLRSLKVKCCDQLQYLFSVLMVKALSQLTDIEVLECNSMKMIVSFEYSFQNLVIVDDNIEFCSLRSLALRSLPAIEDFYSGLLTSSTATKQSSSLYTHVPSSFFDAKVKFSNLETLKLSSIRLENIWQDDQLSAGNSFLKLAKLCVEECSSLKYLFSCSMVRSFPNLKELEIRECEMMEEIISTEGRNGYEMEEVFFPNLETIIIKGMPKLKTISLAFFTSSSISGSLKTMEVSKCEKLDNIFPSYMERAFIGLETLMVSDCNSVQVIFEFSSQMGNAEGTTRLQKLTLLRLSKLKQIWSRDPQENLSFHKLQHVRVENCNNLEYLFPLSIAMHAVHLEDITIKNAERMKQIVSAEEGILDHPVKFDFEFNHLTSLVLWSLKEMEGFFAGHHSLLCPLLRELDIRACAKVKLFKTQCWRSQGRVSTQQPLFTLAEVICKLEKLALNGEHADIILHRQLSSEDFVKLKFLCLARLRDDHAGLPYWFLQKLTSLEALVVQFSYLKEVFHEVILADEKGKFEIRSRIKRLTLFHLPELHHICKEGFQMNPIIEALEKLWVEYCPNMKHLVPSSVTFCQLTYLEVHNCNGLIDLVTSSTARSLVRLTKLKIRDCNSLTQVVAMEREEAEDQINFRSLENLELQRLPKIKCFCSSNCLLNFPLLENVVVKQCPRMNNFTKGGARTPKLSKIRSNEEDEQLYWDGNLNRTINKMFVDMVAFHSFNHLEFSEYPELKELWYGQVGQKIFCNLKRMVVRKCAFLSTMIFSSNLLQVLHTLEELEVAECDSLEAIFDVKALDDKAKESREVSGLKKLTLSGLLNLKHIWNEEAEEIISFGNLQILEVDKCQHLKNLFSVSLCQDLRQLEQLCIESCGVEEIVSVEEGLEKHKFDFPQLTSLKLFSLTQLTNFYPKRYTLECPSLKMLNVSGCEELQVFAFDHLDSQPLSREDDIELQTKQALFHIEKVSQNLEDMSLNENDVVSILNDNRDKKLFQSIKILRLQHFQKTPIKFLNDLIQKFPATTTLQLRHSSFETLFAPKEIGRYSIESPTQIKTLRLFQFDRLEHICKDDDLASHTLVENLEHLSIVECSGIITLVPPSASFKNLTSLEVKDCNGLMFFMTSCTAKSLVHLTSLTISNCGMLEEVVMTDEEESEEDITFKSLMYLELTGLSSFKSFCSATHTFIFLSLVTLKVIGCPKMQNFSSEVIIAPFLNSVEVENGKECWKENLNTTIKQLFIDKAIGESVEGDYQESLGIHAQSSQTHQKRVSTSRALSSLDGAKSKADEIVDSRKQEMHKISIPHAGIVYQKICEIVETPLNQACQNTSNLTKVDAALGTQDETIERPLVQTFHQEKSCSDFRNQEMIKTLEKVLVPVAQNVLRSSMVDNIDAKNREMHETIQRPLVQNAEDVLIPTSIHDIGTGIHAAHGSIEIPFVQSTQNTSDITIAQNKAGWTQETYESKRSFSVPDAQNASNPIMIYNTGKSNDQKINFPKNLSSQTANSAMTKNNASINPAPFQASKVTSSSTTPVENIVLTIGTQDIHAIMDKPLIQTDQDAEKLATAQNTEESHDSFIRTQKISDTIEKPTIPATQNVPNSTMINEAADLDPSASQAQEPMISSIQESNIYRNYKGMVDIPEQNMPYLEAGLKRHPQVLDWLNTKRPRVLASSFFSLFSEVTRILRTTRRVNSTQDYRNCIKECCAALQGVGFDESWISYVHGCVEECAGDEEDLDRKVEETEAQIESMKKELASLEESLELMRHKASRLHDFIES